MFSSEGAGAGDAVVCGFGKGGPFFFGREGGRWVLFVWAGWRRGGREKRVALCCVSTGLFAQRFGILF